MLGRVVLAAVLALAAAEVRGGVPLASVDDFCRLVAARLASVNLSDCIGADLRAVARSAQGLPILMRDFEPQRRGDMDPPRVLMFGGIHGDELSSVSVMFRWMEQLRYDRYNVVHWRVAPTVNPDGLLRRPATRMNANGVDLNRNFPTPDWAGRALPYWERRTGRDPRRYPGPHELSEPESRWLAEEIDRFRPDVIVSLHAPLGLLDFDGPPVPPERLGFLRLQRLGTYPGSLGAYAGEYLGIPVITPELPHAGLMPTGNQIQRIWADLSVWIAQNVQRDEPPPLFLRLATWRWLPPPPQPLAGMRTAAGDGPVRASRLAVDRALRRGE